jgi:hypothetical protein
VERAHRGHGKIADKTVLRAESAKGKITQMVQLPERDMSQELKDLKAQADDMGLAYHPNIGAAKLREKIDAANAENPAAQAVYNEYKSAEYALREAPREELDDAPAADPVAEVADEAPTVAEVIASSEGKTYPPEMLAVHTDALIAAKPAVTMCTPENVTEALRLFTDRGLQIVALTPEYWHIRNGKREDSGNMKMPLSTLKQCAMLLMGRTSMPTEDLSHEEILELKRGSVR